MSLEQGYLGAAETPAGETYHVYRTPAGELLLDTAPPPEEQKEPIEPSTPESDPERTTESTKDDPGQTPNPPADGPFTHRDYAELSPEEQLERATAGVLTGEPEGSS